MVDVGSTAGRSGGTGFSHFVLKAAADQSKIDERIK